MGHGGRGWACPTKPGSCGIRTTGSFLPRAPGRTADQDETAPTKENSRSERCGCRAALRPPSRPNRPRSVTWRKCRCSPRVSLCAERRICRPARRYLVLWHHLGDNLVNAEARWLLARWELLEALQPLHKEGRRGVLQKHVLDEPIVVLEALLAALEWVCP